MADAIIARSKPAAQTVSHFIDGRVVHGHGVRTSDIYNPATGSVTACLELADGTDIDNVVQVARRAESTWREAPLTKRTKVLFALRQCLVDNIDSLAGIISNEHGKVIDDAKGEVGRAIESVEYACGIIDHLKGGYSSQVATDIDVYSFRQPLGVVAGISPFNFPIMVPMWMAPLAIATGNAFILKPSPRDPSVSLVIAQLWRDAGLPDGVFNVVQGDKEAVDAILSHPGIDGVSFVGSTPVAKYVFTTATANRKRVQALGGAKNHVVVMPDADMDIAADYVSKAAFGSAGERCMAISVAVAVGAASDGLVERLGEHARKIVVAEGTRAGADMGPLVSHAAKQRVERIIGDAQAAGAQLVVDGRGLVVPGHEHGFFVGPTVVDKVRREMTAYSEEIFGPVAVVMRAPSLDDAINLINSNPYGNGTGIFTTSGLAAREFQRRVHVGMVGINIPIPVPVAWYSFGGWGESLFGDYHIYGDDGVRFYTRKKVVTQRWGRTGNSNQATFSFPSH